MTRTRTIIMTVLFILLIGAPCAFAAGGTITLTLGDRYTGGETILLGIKYAAGDGSPVVLDNPARLKVEITKPDGSVVKSQARKRAWNAPGEYFDVYTVDYMGDYKVKVTDPETGLAAAAGFDSVFITPSSLGVIIFAIALLLACVVYGAIASRKKTAKA
jgi:hypothetical protein